MPDPATNSLIIFGTAQEFQNIKNILKDLDMIPRQVLMEFLVAEVTLADDLRFGVEYELRRRVSAPDIIGTVTPPAPRVGLLGTLWSLRPFTIPLLWVNALDAASADGDRDEDGCVIDFCARFGSTIGPRFFGVKEKGVALTVRSV